VVKALNIGSDKGVNDVSAVASGAIIGYGAAGLILDVAGLISMISD